MVPYCALDQLQVFINALVMEQPNALLNKGESKLLSSFKDSLIILTPSRRGDILCA